MLTFFFHGLKADCDVFVDTLRRLRIGRKRVRRASIELQVRTDAEELT